jgi:hypothetical protein
MLINLIHFEIKFRIPNSSGSLTIALKSNGYYIYHLFCYSKHCILPTYFIYVFHTIVAINRGYFPSNFNCLEFVIETQCGFCEAGNKFQNIMTDMTIARQRLGEHYPAAYALSNRASIAR